VTGAWRKRGLLIAPRADHAWAAVHTMLPVPSPLAGADGTHRIYLTGRGGDGRGAIGWCDVDLALGQAHTLAAAPVLRAGELGAFDDSGVSSSAVVEHGGRLYLYYTGWTKGVTVPFYVFLGLAVSDDAGLTFHRHSRAPILERSNVDPFLTGHPSVIVENGTWRMWYVSCSSWRLVDGAPRHYYHVRYAESPDGVAWRRTGHVCIDYADEAEYAIARPWVMRDGGGYRMWFSHRGGRYRIGYAESADGLAWTRCDGGAGIDVSAEGWDSESIEYPCVLPYEGREYMLYNGNGYGRTGIGLAERP
jgi:hypothetical protein